MMSEQEIVKNLNQVRRRIDAACRRSGRDPKTVRLVGVTKKKPVDMIIQALNAELMDLGENYVQEFRTKYEQVAASGYSPTWHFIGRLQSKKVKYLNNRVQWIHSLDRERLLNEIARRFERPVNCLIEVNIGEELEKGGIAPADLNEFALAVSARPKCVLRGLMCIPPVVKDPEDARPFFRDLVRLLQEMKAFLKAKDVDTSMVTELSMGMSLDFEQAIEEGATMVRVGTAIFGARL